MRTASTGTTSMMIYWFSVAEHSEEPVSLQTSHSSTSKRVEFLFLGVSSPAMAWFEARQLTLVGHTQHLSPTSGPAHKYGSYMVPFQGQWDRYNIGAS